MGFYYFIIGISSAIAVALAVLIVLELQKQKRNKLALAQKVSQAAVNADAGTAYASYGDEEIFYTEGEYDDNAYYYDENEQVFEDDQPNDEPEPVVAEQADPEGQCYGEEWYDECEQQSYYTAEEVQAIVAMVREECEKQLIEMRTEVETLRRERDAVLGAYITALNTVDEYSCENEVSLADVLDEGSRD